MLEAAHGIAKPGWHHITSLGWEPESPRAWESRANGCANNQLQGCTLGGDAEGLWQLVGLDPSILSSPCGLPL